MAKQRQPFDAVQFTRESAERIAGVVRSAELAAPAASPLTFAKRLQDRVPKQVRAATFTGSWAIGSEKTVQFSYSPTATAAVTNLVWPLTKNVVQSRACIVGKDGSRWLLVAPELKEQQAIVVTQTQNMSVLTNITLDAWIDEEYCDVVIAKTNHTASVRVISALETTTFLVPKD